MIEVMRFINHPVNSNCFVVFNRNWKDCIVIDPGSEDSAHLLEFLKHKKFNPVYIVLTHHHFDHIWGLENLKKHYPDAYIVCSEDCHKRIVDRKQNLSLYFNQIGFDAPGADIVIHGHTHLEFHTESVALYISRGHSESSIIIKIGDNLFTGDNLIFNETTVLKLPTSSKSDFLTTLERIKSFKGHNLIVRGGHGSDFLLDDYDILKAIK